MKSLNELKLELRKISSMFNSDSIPLTVDGKEIESVKLHDDCLSGGGYRIEIKTREYNDEKDNVQ